MRPRTILYFMKSLQAETYAVSVPREGADKNLDRAVALQGDGLIAVFDGISSSALSERASQIACDEVRGQDMRVILQTADTIEELRCGIRDLFQMIGLKIALDYVRQRNAGATERFMGTTAVIGKSFEDPAGEHRGFLFRHIGDSRLYQRRGKSLRCLTVDHTPLTHRLLKLPNSGEKLFEWQKIIDNIRTEKGLRQFLESIGMRGMQRMKSKRLIAMQRGLMDALQNVLPENFAQIEAGTGGGVKVEPEDELFALTDGVHGNMTFDELERIAVQNAPLKVKAQRMIRRAQRNSHRKETRFHPDDMSLAGIKFIERTPHL